MGHIQADNERKSDDLEHLQKEMKENVKTKNVPQLGLFKKHCENIVQAEGFKNLSQSFRRPNPLSSISQTNCSSCHRISNVLRSKMPSWPTLCFEANAKTTLNNWTVENCNPQCTEPIFVFCQTFGGPISKHCHCDMLCLPKTLLLLWKSPKSFNSLEIFPCPCVFSMKHLLFTSSKQCFVVCKVFATLHVWSKKTFLLASMIWQCPSHSRLAFCSWVSWMRFFLVGF